MPIKFFESYLKRIQLDAFKAGMSRAADIACDEEIARHSFTDRENTRAEVRHNILIDRDNLKELP